MPKTYLALIPCLTLFVACSSDGIPGSTAFGGAPSSAGAAGQTQGIAGQTQGAAGQTQGSAGASGAGTAGSGEAGTGTGGGSGVAGAAGGGVAGGGAAGGTAWTFPKGGKSAGCGKAPTGGDLPEKAVTHTVDITGLDPIYLPGGKLWEDKKKDKALVGTDWSWAHRAYAVRLPKNYDPNKAYPVTLGGGGCGGNMTDFAKSPNASYQVDGLESIQVGLSYLAGCFDDGAIEFTNPDNTKGFRKDTPEVPYVRAVIAQVQANYCTEKSQVYIAGSSSGGWESFTVGCAAADVIRSIGPTCGGLRLNRPMCAGPQAAFIIEALGDTENPIGPMDPPVGRLDSPGSGPARDEILKRNGCVAPDFKPVYGGAGDDGKYTQAPHEMWDPAFPRCMKYTGCPAAYPVVWCSMTTNDPKCQHQCDKDNNIDYKKGLSKFLASLAPKAP